MTDSLQPRFGLGTFLALALALPTQPARDPAEAREEVKSEFVVERGLPALEPDCKAADIFGGSDIERSAYCALRVRNFASVRTLATRALKRDRASFRALYLLGAAQHRGEGNLPKSLRLLERAEKALTVAYGPVLEEGDPLRPIAYRILFELMDVHGEMDHHEERIAYADAITERLSIDHRASKAWPLMKLGRFKEARAVVEEALASDDQWNRSVARTSRCAIESELRNRMAAYEACREAAEPARQRSRGGAVELTNAGAAAEEVLKFGEAERLYLEAAERAPETSVNPWGRLVHLYLAEGRFSEALGAWREMQAYRARRQHAYLDQQDESEAQLAGAAVMIIAGRVDLAEPITRRIVGRPDRQGTSSAASEQNEAGAALVARVARRVKARRLEEEAAIAPFFDAIQLRTRAARLRFDAWMVARRAARILAKPERLITTLRPEVPGSLELPGWLDAEVISLVGPGVSAVALEQSRADETLPEALTAPVFDAYQAEIAWLRGEYETAYARGRSAMENAGKGLTLVGARGGAWAADAAGRLGRSEAARALYRGVLDRDPEVLRRLDLALPVRFEVAGSALARSAAQLLRGSPAFNDVGWGFRLVVDDGGARLLGLDGSELANVRADAAAPDPDEEGGTELTPERQLASEIQSRILSPLLDITQVDVRSLDGGLGRGVRARDQIELPPGSVGR